MTYSTIKPTETAASRPEANSLSHFGDRLGAVCASHGLQFYLAAYFPAIDRAGLLGNLLVTNWPDDLLSRYEHTDMFRQSRIIQGLKRSILPVYAGSLLHAKAKEEGVSSELVGVYHDDGFANTLGLSLFDINKRQYLIMLSGEREVADETELGLIILESMKALDRLVDADSNSRGLSSRELDCLRWAAAGKSSDDIAIILGLSAHTVNTYLKTAMIKLDTVTRTQAVAVACRLRLI